MKTKALSMIFVFLLVSALVSGSMAAADDLKVSLCICNMEHPYFLAMRDGANDAADKYGVKLSVFDGQNSPATQMGQVEDSLVTGADAILLNPTSVSAMSKGVKEAVSEGIPVFTLDRDVKEGDRVAYIGTSNTKAAEKGAQQLVEALEAATKFGSRTKPWRIVMLQGTPGSSAAIERKAGFHNVLMPMKEAGKIEVITDTAAGFNKAKGLSVMEDTLATTKDLDAVIAANDEMALGAVQALKSAGIKVGFPDGVLVQGFDAIDDALQAIRERDMIGTVAQAPYIMGYWGVEAVYKYLKEGWRPPEGLPIYEPTGAVHMNTGATIVNTSNVDRISELVTSPPPLPGE